ncbi:MAG: transposase [Candidatus Omnitrophica bacterium]|nr:transposase [Candidatus Omnitrophota bacterium]
MRKMPLVKGNIYHIYTKSIAKFKIFQKSSEYKRLEKLFSYYRTGEPPLRFSAFLQLKNQEAFLQNRLSQKKNIVEIITYCIMPTHIHLIIKQLSENGISIFMKNVLNSYSRYFNIKIKRKGPLWQGRFKNKLVKNEEQLLHLSRYIHLNPVSANLVSKPKDWQYSSYRYYLGLVNNSQNWLSNLFNYVESNPNLYEKFVNDNLDCQKELEKIKHLSLE